MAQTAHEQRKAGKFSNGVPRGRGSSKLANFIWCSKLLGVFFPGVFVIS